MKGIIGTLFSMELRRVLAYRFDFWVQFVGTVVIQMTVAWFLWSAVFKASGQRPVAGYNFDQMMFYYLLVPLIDRVNRGFDNFQLSREIYDGSLTRYLLYPVSFFWYKYIGQLARAVISVVQLMFGLAAFLVIFGRPDGCDISIVSFIQSMFLCLLGGLCYFLMSMLTELIAFWAENVWSLMVMLRFVVQMLGGAFLPLALFPGWARSVLVYTPFPGIVDVPSRVFMGLGQPNEVVTCALTMIVWALILGYLVKVVLARGLREYTGVGI